MSKANDEERRQIIAICTGNICRSAMAEVVLSATAERVNADVIISSSGVSSEEQGNPMDFRAVNALKMRGYDIESDIVKRHSARKITRDEVESADMLLAMTRAHADALINRFGADPDKVYLYRYFEDTAHSQPLSAPDLADPWYGGPSDFEVALDQIEKSADDIIALFLSY